MVRRRTTVTLHKNGDAARSPTTAAASGGHAPEVQEARPGTDPHHAALRRKFGDNSSYIHSGGLHGVGSSVVNALSKKLVATIRRDGSEWQQSLAAMRKQASVASNRLHGTTIMFQPDDQISRPRTSTRTDQVPPRRHVLHPQRFEDCFQERAGETHDLLPWRHPGVPRVDRRRAEAEGHGIAVPPPRATARSRSLQWTESTDETIRLTSSKSAPLTAGTVPLKSGVVKAVKTSWTHDVSGRVDITAGTSAKGSSAFCQCSSASQFQGQTKESCTTRR